MKKLLWIIVTFINWNIAFADTDWPLIEAIRRGSLEQVVELVEKSPERLQFILTPAGRDPTLHFVVNYGSYPVNEFFVSKLIETGHEDVLYTRDDLKLTPLHYAAQRGDSAIVRLLVNQLIRLQHPEQLYAASELNETPLHFVTDMRDAKFVYPSVVNKTSEEILTEENDRNEIVKFLIEKLKEIHHPEKVNAASILAPYTTALHNAACSFKSPGVVQVLLKAGARIFPQNFDCAKRVGNEEIATLLRDVQLAKENARENVLAGYAIGVPLDHLNEITEYLTGIPNPESVVPPTVQEQSR